MAGNLILCGDHKLAPWSVVCVHLVEGTSKEWMPVPIEPQDRSHPDVEYDWLCRECSSLSDEPQLDNLKAICIHCVRELQAEAGYEPEGDET